MRMPGFVLLLAFLIPFLILDGLIALPECVRRRRGDRR